MSFEEEIEDNMWRDAQYEDNFEYIQKYKGGLTPHIIYEEPRIPINYSDNDVPLADCIVRRALGFNHAADVQSDMDTYLDEYST